MSDPLRWLWIWMRFLFSPPPLRLRMRRRGEWCCLWWRVVTIAAIHHHDHHHCVVNLYHAPSDSVIKCSPGHLVEFCFSDEARTCDVFRIYQEQIYFESNLLWVLWVVKKEKKTCINRTQAVKLGGTNAASLEYETRKWQETVATTSFTGKEKCCTCFTTECKCSSICIYECVLLQIWWLRAK